MKQFVDPRLVDPFFVERKLAGTTLNGSVSSDKVYCPMNARRQGENASWQYYLSDTTLLPFQPAIFGSVKADVSTYDDPNGNTMRKTTLLQADDVVVGLNDVGDEMIFRDAMMASLWSRARQQDFRDKKWTQKGRVATNS
jgi:hypothetical protein